MVPRNTLRLIILLAAPALQPHRAAGQAACPTGRVAVVQTSVIFASIDSFAVKDTALTGLVNAYKVEVSLLQAVMDSVSLAYQEKSALLPAAAREVERQKLDDQNAQVQQRIRVLQQQAAQQRARLLQPIETGVQRVIDSIRTELKCAIIFDISAGTGITSMNKSLDLTQRVIDRIKATGDTTLFGPHPPPSHRP